MDITSVQNTLALQKDMMNQSTSSTSGTNFEEVFKEALENQDDTKLREGCEELETYMLSYVFKQMKSTMLTGDRLVEKGDYEEMFEDQMIDTITKDMVKAGGIGLADSMYKQMVRSYKAQSMESGSNGEIAQGSTVRIDDEV